MGKYDHKIKEDKYLKQIKKPESDLDYLNNIIGSLQKIEAGVSNYFIKLRSYLLNIKQNTIPLIEEARKRENEKNEGQC
jgi:hypothetical protein